MHHVHLSTDNDKLPSLPKDSEAGANYRRRLIWLGHRTVVRPLQTMRSANNAFSKQFG